MSKRHSKSLSFFSEPAMLLMIVNGVLSRTGTHLCRAQKRDGHWLFLDVEAPIAVGGRLPQLYPCHAAMIKRGGLSSLANIVQISLPAHGGGDLRMGEVGMLVADSELDESTCQLQQRIYRELRKELAQRFNKGVWGRNSRTGGEHFYKDILIAKDIEEKARKGLVLRPVLGDGFVTFSPDRSQ